MTSEASTYAKISPELKALHQWVGWKLIPAEPKPKKIPYQPHHPDAAASTTDPTHWATYDEAVKAYDEHGFSGIGFVFAKEDLYVGIDLDHCRAKTTGHLDPWAQQIVEQLHSYTEVSQSGTGIHIIVKGQLPEGGRGRKKGDIEMYGSGRYFCMTGEHVDGNPMEIHKRQAELETLHATTFGTAKAIVAHDKLHDAVNLDDQELVQKAMRAKSGAAFKALWDGDMSGYPSHSEADLALCSHLNFWTGGDATRMDQLFRASGLLREKWDERHGEETYGEMTIRKACETTTDYYQPAHKNSPTLLSTQNGLGNPSSSSADRRVVLLCADSIEPEETTWAWEGRIACGELNILAGDPGLAKTTIAIDRTARWSRGQCEGIFYGTPVHVVIASAEDSPSHTLIPRLMAAGADLSLIHFVALQSGNDQTYGGLVLPDDVSLLAEQIKAVQAKVLIIDPLMAHLSPDVNSWRDQDVRSALAPLSALANDCGMTVLVVAHLNKGQGQNPKYRVGGSIGILAAARSVLLVGEDPEDETGRVLLHLKCNVGAQAVGLRYGVESQNIDYGEKTLATSRIVWRGEAPGLTAETVLDHKKTPDEQSALEEAKEWLQDYLADQPGSATAILGKARKEGISERTLNRAKKDLGVETFRKGFGKEGVSMWRLSSQTPHESPSIHCQESAIDCQYPEVGNLCVSPEKNNNFHKGLPIHCQSTDIGNQCVDLGNLCEEVTVHVDVTH